MTAESGRAPAWPDLGAPSVGLVHAVFRSVAADAPTAAAVVADGVPMSYAELDRLSDEMASSLVDAGVTVESTVAVYLRPSAALVVAILGCLKAGAALVPVDPDYPPARARELLTDAAPAAVVTSSDLAADLPGPTAAVRVTVTADGRCADEPRHRSPSARDRAGPRLTGDNAACVIYTSGSTGTPRGVVITHSGLLHLAQAAAQRFELRTGDRFLQMASVSFSAFLEEVFPSLLHGGTVVLAGYRRALTSVPHLLELVARERITGFGITTSHWHEVVTEMVAAGTRFPPCLRFVLMGGERAPSSSVAAWPRLGVPMIHVYGPTEFTATATYLHTGEYDVSDGRLPIGTAIAGARLRLLDERLSPVADGAPGEVYLAGIPLARGYLGRPAETADRFVPDPLCPAGSRMYRTGDLARRLPDGNVEFLGRVDEQVKIRGYRVEPAEVEHALITHPAVRAAVVVMREDRTGDRRLVAYVVPDGAAPSPVDLRAHAAARLPDHLVPSAYGIIDALPLTPNGKLDRGALPRLPAARADAWPYVPPAGDTERRIAEQWAELLGVELVGATDDFFELGGHSLLVTRALGAVRADFGVELCAAAFFDGRTVRAVAAVVDAERGRDVAPGDTDLRRIRARRALVSRALAREGAPPGAVPLSPSQHGLWVLQELAPDVALYSVPWRCGLRGPLDVDALRDALTAVVARHPILRSRFGSVDGTPYQFAAAVEPVALTVHDLTGLAPAERARVGAELAQQEAAEPFGLAAGPVFRARLFRLADDDHELMCNAHHIVFDGRSVRVFLDELAQQYAVATGRASGPGQRTEDRADYADFAIWQRERLRGKRLDTLVAYWQDRLAGAPAVLELRTDRPRRPDHAYAGANLRLPLSCDLRATVADLVRAERATDFIVALAAHVALLHRRSGATDICVGVPAQNRVRPEFERVMGFFVNTLVIRVGVSDDPTLRELVRRTREACLGAYDHQELPFDQLVAHLRPQRVDGANPLFQVNFSVDDAPGLGAEMPGLAVRPGAEVCSGRARFDMSWLVENHGDGWVVSVDYSTDLFEDATVAEMIGEYQRLLESFAADPDQRLSAVVLDPPSAGDRELALATGPGSVECVLQAMWAEAFDVDGVDLDDDFFELGGYSMLAAQLCLRIRELFGVELPLKAFFETPTIGEIADKVRAAASEGTVALDVIAPERRERTVEELLDEIESLSDDEVAAAMADWDSEG